jgi:hypothetical protein
MECNLTFTLIQLIEGMIWISINTNNQKLNSLATVMVLIALNLQPLVQCGMGYLFTNNKILLALTVLIAIILGIQLLRIFSTPIKNFHSYVGDKGHLIWEDKSLQKSSGIVEGNILGPPLIIGLYLIGLFLPLFFMKNYRGLPLVCIGLITLIYSMYQTQGKEFGSLWCITSVSYALVAIFVS